jgi:hypothetical protein
VYVATRRARAAPPRSCTRGRKRGVMSGAWNGKDGRAHLPTPEMLTSQDVLPAAAAGVAGSLSPFSLGFYSVDREPHAGAARDDSAFKCLPLLWVSDAVAEDRAKTSPPMERSVHTRPFAAGRRWGGVGGLWADSL